MKFFETIRSARRSFTTPSIIVYTQARMIHVSKPPSEMFPIARTNALSISPIHEYYFSGARATLGVRGSNRRESIWSAAESIKAHRRNQLSRRLSRADLRGLSKNICTGFFDVVGKIDDEGETSFLGRIKKKS